MKKTAFLLHFLAILSSIAVAQIRSEDNIVGSKVLIQSGVLKQEREIQVYLPDSYASSEKTFPVLYLLDGQRYFLHGVSIQKTFAEFRQSPDFIVVGVSKLPSDRNRNYSSNSTNYLNFIKSEVIKYVDSSYRTSKDRILFGWAFAGGFVIETLIKEPDLFSSYIAASPFPLSGKIKKIDSLIQVNTVLENLLFFTSGANEGSVKEGTSELNKLLIANAERTPNWKFEELQGEVHRSTPFTTLYRGIKHHFDFYPELQFNSLEEFIDAGGLPFVYDYYRKRASKYGFSSDLTDWTMFSLVRNAIRANSFSHFEQLHNEFNPTGYFERLRESRACTIADFYLKNQKTDEARELFLKVLELYPASERACQGIGNSYQAEEKEEMARKYFQKAEELVKGN